MGKLGFEGFFGAKNGQKWANFRVLGLFWGQKWTEMGKLGFEGFWDPKTDRNGQILGF